MTNHELDEATNTFLMAVHAEKSGNFVTSERLFRLAAEKGITRDTPEKLDPGTVLWSEGSDADDAGDYALAEIKFLAAAKLGISEAMNALGNLYDGYADPADPLEAIYWYVRAYRAGDYCAPWNLAMHFVHRRNHRWYGFWMRKSAESGHEEAIEEMAKIDADPGYMTKLPFE